MTTILGFLRNGRLSLEQWLLLTGAITIGALVTALRLQGSKLHSAQVSLLTDHLNNVQLGKDAAVDAAKARFDKAMEEYNAASK